MTEHQYATTEVWNLGPKTETEVFEALFPNLLQNGAEHIIISASKRAGWDLVEMLLAHGYRVGMYRYTIIYNDIHVYMVIYVCMSTS